MPSHNKQTCPTCGQSVNKREIHLFSGLVGALFSVYQWCGEEQKHEFTKKEIKHLIKDDVVSGVFAYLRWFGGLVYNPDGIRGHYGLNMERCQEFFAGRLSIPTMLLKDPLEKDEEKAIEKLDYRKIDQIPNLSEFLDENKEYIAKYQGRLL
jgi:hypothetical protein